jgi:MerR family copper efflux transcriptional regulator
MQIAIVAKKIGLSVDAIRFYERNGLLPRQPRTQGGSRRYGDTDVETVGFVRRVQGLGFTLSEIRGLLKLRGNRLQPCAPVQLRLQEKRADVQRKLRDLQKLVICPQISWTVDSSSFGCAAECSRAESVPESDGSARVSP